MYELHIWHLCIALAESQHRRQERHNKWPTHNLFGFGIKSCGNGGDRFISHSVEENELPPNLSTKPCGDGLHAQMSLICVYWSILGDIRLWVSPRKEHLLSSWRDPWVYQWLYAAGMPSNDLNDFKYAFEQVSWNDSKHRLSSIFFFINTLKRDLVITISTRAGEIEWLQSDRMTSNMTSNRWLWMIERWMTQDVCKGCRFTVEDERCEVSTWSLSKRMEVDYGEEECMTRVHDVKMNGVGVSSNDFKHLNAYKFSSQYLTFKVNIWGHSRWTSHAGSGGASAALGSHCSPLPGF